MRGSCCLARLLVVLELLVVLHLVRLLVVHLVLLLDAEVGGGMVGGGRGSCRQATGIHRKS